MRKVMVAMMVGVLALCGIAHAEAKAADAALELALVLQFAEEMGVQDYELLEVLQGYREYRSMMDNYTSQRAEKSAALEEALAKDESSTVIMGLTRDLMNIDMNILRLKQSSVNEASSVMGAKAVAQLYLMVADLDKAKADMMAALSGKADAQFACPMMADGSCPMAGTAACPKAAAAAEAPAEESDAAILEQAMFFLNKVAAKDLDAALSAVSDKFEHYEYGTKEELRLFLDQAILMGYLDDLKIITDDTEVKKEDGKVVIYPIDVEGLFGSFTLELTCHKEDGKWMVTTMDVFGI